MKNVVFKSGNNIQVFRYGTTSNNKIESDKKRKIVQTYTFSRSQYEKILAKVKGMKPFFNSADSNCLDCPFNSFGKCYTHKFNQFVGFVSMLKSIAKKYGEFDNIPRYNEQMRGEIVDLSRNTYVRFGTYGEPSEHPTELIQLMAEVASNWTGYTHQWHMKRELSDYFMASVHNVHQEKRAATLGFRSFIASDDKIQGIVNCPASKEAGNKSTCSKCGLCSGTKGKGNKSIYILTH